MMEKCCTNKECKNNNPQPIENFCFCKNKKGGGYYKGKCRTCLKEYNREYGKNYRIKNKEHKQQYNQEYYNDPINKTRKQEYDKIYFQKEDVKQRRKEYYKEYNLKNKELIQSRVKEHNQTPVAKEKKRKRARRYRNVPENKLHQNVSRIINMNLNNSYVSKNDKSCKLYLNNIIDNYFQKLKEHLEALFDLYMTWENYGSYWHLDHIVASSKLPYSSMEDDNFKICWSLSNLQPLRSDLNIKKGNKDWEEFKQSKDYQDYLKEINALPPA